MISKNLIALSIIAQQQAKPGIFEAFLLPIIIIFAIFYFILILPQQRRAKAHRKYLDSLQKGEKVITSGGILGTVAGITENIVTLEVEGGVKLKVLKDQIMGPYKEKGKQK